MWAVEVDEELVAALRELPATPNAAPIEVVHGDFDDPKLPDGRVDLVLLSSVYLHIEDRAAYMERLRTDLASEGRVAILEPAAGWASRLLLLPPGHAVAVPTIREEMEAGGRPARGLARLPAGALVRGVRAAAAVTAPYIRTEYSVPLPRNSVTERKPLAGSCTCSTYGRSAFRNIRMLSASTTLPVCSRGASIWSTSR